MATVARIAGEANDTYHRIGIMCSEASWRRCHRQDIASHMWSAFNKVVEHIRPNGWLEPHPVHHITDNHEETLANANIADSGSQPSTEPAHRREETIEGFALTPDGEEHFGFTVDSALLASLIDYHNSPIEVQMGLDQKSIWLVLAL